MYFTRRTLTSSLVFMEGSPEVVRTWMGRLLAIVYVVVPLQEG